jgi:hypothetical protein
LHGLLLGDATDVFPILVELTLVSERHPPLLAFAQGLAIRRHANRVHQIDLGQTALSLWTAQGLGGRFENSLGLFKAA